MNIYEIDHAINYCIEIAEEEGWTLEVIEALNSLQLSKEEKIDNICFAIKQAKLDCESLKALEDSYKEKRGIATRRLEGLKAYLSDVLQGEKYKNTGKGISVYYHKSEKAITPDDVSLLPDEFVKIQKTPIVEGIKKALKAGAVIEGCSLVKSTSIVVR